MTTIDSSTRTNAGKGTIWRPTAVAAVVAAVATSLVGAAGRAAGASLEIDGEVLPLSGFFTVTLICVAVGFGLALAARRWAANPRQTFVRAAVALTVCSFVPDLLVSAAASTRFTLMTSHLVAAAIVIPVVAARLSTKRA